MTQQLTVTLDETATALLPLLADSPDKQRELLSTFVRIAAGSRPIAPDLSLAALAQRIAQLEAQVADLQEAWDELEDAGWARVYRDDKAAPASENEVIPLEQIMIAAG